MSILSTPARVVVGIDASAVSLAAAALAADEAVARGTSLVLVHVAADSNHHRGVLADAAAAISRRYPGLELMTRPVVGDPAVALAAESHGADLLVVGHRGHCGHRGGRAGHREPRGGGGGSVAERVAGLATVPVLVHRSGPEGPPSVPVHRSGADGTPPVPVLVGLAPGRVDDAVLEFAFAAAARRAAPLHALTVWSDFDAGADGPIDSRPVVAETSAAIQRWCDKYPDVPVEVVVRHGLDATIALTAATHAAQLAVIGAGGAGTPTQTGSLAHALIHRAACPVVVVPAGADPESPQ